MPLQGHTVYDSTFLVIWPLISIYTMHTFLKKNLAISTLCSCHFLSWECLSILSFKIFKCYLLYESFNQNKSLSPPETPRTTSFPGSVILITSYTHLISPTRLHGDIELIVPNTVPPTL